MKLKRLRTGFLNAAKKRLASAKADLRMKPPQLGALSDVQEAIEKCEACVVTMATLLDKSHVRVCSDKINKPHTRQENLTLTVSLSLLTCAGGFTE